jgi:hypothetical protein
MRTGILIWLDPSLRPSPRVYEKIQKTKIEGKDFQLGSLAELVCKFEKQSNLLPWIKMPTGKGAAFFGISEILAMKDAFCGQKS